MKKSIISLAGVLGVLFLCLGVAGYHNWVNAENTQPVVTRGVIDQLEQIPESKRTAYDSGTDIRGTLGTKENPFFILEIVPYEEYAEFGYQISGCEPIDVMKMQYGNGDINTVASLRGGTVTNCGKAFFFQDEIDEKYASNYSASKDTNEVNRAYNGYYEKTNDKEGFFVQNADGSMAYQGQGKGNIIWHTVNDFEREQYPNQSFQDDTTKSLTNNGDRMYTTRQSSSDDCIQITYNYYEYTPNDYFLKDSLELQTDEEVEDYSIIIKTITPAELNNNSKWADYADLFVVSPKTHDGNVTGLWKKYNRLGHTSQTTNYANGFGYTQDSEKNRDITWDVALKMYQRINREINYAAIVMDAQSYTDETLTGGKKVTTQILDWNLKPSGDTESNYTGYNINMYKLAVMLLSMNPDLFQELYLSGDTPLIQDGKCLVQEGDAQTYWTMFTFLPSDVSGEAIGANWYSYWTSKDKWENYETAGNITTDGNRNYVNRRLVTFNSDNSITQDFGRNTIDLSSQDYKFQDFKNFMNGEQKASTADAVRYILGNGKASDSIDGELKILDIEPCYDSKNGYELQESFIRLMIPQFKGTVTLRHMTTAEFIGSSEDLNSTYNMIFMGLDDGAYNHEVKWFGEEQKNVSCTKWNDTLMSGKIYFHTGDLMTSAEYTRGDGRNRSVKFLTKGTKNGSEWSWSDVDSTVLRFPGNDITKLKQKELEDFVRSGNPVIAVPYLYQRNSLRIDQYSNISNFVKTETDSKEQGNSSVHFYQADDVNGIKEYIKQEKPAVSFVQTPKLYNGVDTSISDPQYLDTDDVGRALLPFGFTVSDPDHAQYRCNVYLDQNQDGKFSEDELYYEGEAFTADGSAKAVTCKISRLYMGLIQWKIEVFRVDNPSVRFTQTGCSAARNQTGQKKQINVLQIIPKDGDFQGKLDLSTNPLFTQYYNSLDDYEIHVTTETVDTFKKHFDDENKFTRERYQSIINDPDAETPEWLNVYRNYNMIIIGFGDTYGGINIPNDNGEMDFLKFYIEQGKSVLFTHDLTSMHNVRNEDFGYSANTYLRDIMGMNRYKAISRNLSVDERKALEEKPDDGYDTVTDVNGNALDQKQGFTYYAMKRLGWTNSDGGTDWNTLLNQKMPYQYLITNPSGESICGYGDRSLAKNTGFNNNNDLTTKVTQSNQGQITQYPFKIDPEFTISETHAQWYQLDMEDPEVTVWYCLADDGRYSAWQETDNNGKGTGATYGVSPNDAANNYYIYSKGNVFYSGVGHSTITGEMEAKLFINTMIAAYRASYVAPMVEVMNEDTTITDVNNLSYDMNFAQEYNDDSTDASWVTAGTDNDEDEFVKIIFSPEELNAISTKMDCSIYYKDENGNKVYVDAIYDNETDQEIPLETAGIDASRETCKTVEADGKVVFQNVKNMKEYYFLYPKKYLDTWTETKADNTTISHAAWRNIVFQIKNNKNDEYGYTKLNMNVQELFMLD
ncbi:MAG: DUF5057 domain-containing protein [Roseburia sp.]|nr:DUF5057 domain-containing protein [Roseburia sp.]